MSKALCPILTLKNLQVSYGNHQVLTGVDLKICEGEIVVLVGANGAGKSTLLKSMAGLVDLKAGELEFQSEQVLPNPVRMLELGICFVPQDYRVFPEMTVTENLELGGYILSDKKLILERIKDVFNLFPDLKRLADKKAGGLSGGQRQILALGRAMMLKPKVLLLDEPSVGLAPKIIKDVFAKITKINDQYNTTVVIVEHNLKTLLEIADKAVILYKGKIAKEDKPQALIESNILQEVFFGNLAS